MVNQRSKSEVRWLLGTALAGLAVLAATYTDRKLSAVQPQSSAAYHDNIVAIGSEMPKQVGQWIGVDMPLQEGAIKILHPNLTISRRFTHVTKGYSVDLLILHVRDARDILGHYPPVCYPRMGWLTEGAAPQSWEVAGRQISGVEYEFSKGEVGHRGDMVVDNFLIVKDKPFCRDMDEVQGAAKDGRRKIFGAAQVQVLCSAAMSAEERSEAFHDLIEGNMPVIEAIQKGEDHVERK